MAPAAPALLIRASIARVYDHGDRTVLLAPDGTARALEGDSAHLCRAVLAFLTAPRTRAALLAHLGELAGEPIADPAVIDELLGVLRASGVVRDASAHGQAKPAITPGGARVVLCVTGAVWAVNVPALLGALQRRGCDVRVAMTPSARRFVTAPALAALTHSGVYTSIFRGDARCPVPHINLAEWADAVLVAPASATTLSRIARGDCSDLVSAIAVATRAPVLLVPSMNPAMYSAPAVQRNLDTLRDDGFALAHPVMGVEVAHRPDERAAVFGPAPPPDDVAALFVAMLAARPRRAAPVDEVIPWDEIYRSTPVAALPWHTDAPEADTLEALARFAPAPARLLDIGTGEGTLALAAAKGGYTVVATDVSSAALGLAAERAAGLAVTFVRDDIAASDVRGSFDVVHDRGCLHVLAVTQRAAYVAAVERLTRGGGHVVLKVHHPDAAPRRTHPMTAGEIKALFADGFECVHTAASTLGGPDGGEPAVLAVLRRRG